MRFNRHMFIVAQNGTEQTAVGAVNKKGRPQAAPCKLGDLFGSDCLAGML